MSNPTNGAVQQVIQLMTFSWNLLFPDGCSSGVKRCWPEQGHKSAKCFLTECTNEVKLYDKGSQAGQEYKNAVNAH